MKLVLPPSRREFAKVSPPWQPHTAALVCPVIVRIHEIEADVSVTPEKTVYVDGAGLSTYPSVNRRSHRSRMMRARCS